MPNLQRVGVQEGRRMETWWLQMTPDEAHGDPLMEPTSEFAMRHAANGLIHLVNNSSRLSREDLETLNYAYQQLHRGANTLHTTRGTAS